MTNRIRRWLSPAILLPALVACGSGSDGGPDRTQGKGSKAVATEVGQPLEEPITQTIGPDGGSLESADGSLRIDVPAGALTAEQLVSIQPISAHAHGNVGGAFRIGPEGTTFTAPVRLTFSFAPEQVLGTSPELLRVASQNLSGFWEVHENIELDSGSGTVAIETSHFSDWSLVTGALLSPFSATVKAGETVPLTVVVCERVQPDDFLAPLLAECRSSEVYRALVKNWSVNGNPGGSGGAGTVSVLEDGSAVYSAPARAPEPNTVAVSAEYTSLQGEAVVLVSDVTVLDGMCTKANPFDPCRFELVDFNGEPLPFEDLPRQPWEDPEVLTSGVLNLWDSDGDGAGTWSMRHVWVDKRPSGDLKKFSQLAGDFTSEPSGKLHFTSLGGAEPFSGTLSQGSITLEGYPFATTNAELAARLTFR